MLSSNEIHRSFNLLTGPLGATKHRLVFGWLRHPGIPVGSAEAIEIQSPHMKPRRVQFVTPGPSIEPMRDREGGGKCRSMDVKNNSCQAGSRSRAKMP